MPEMPKYLSWHNIHSYELCIRMHAAKDIVYAEIGHQDGEECKEHVQMIVFRGLQELDRFMVQRYGIDKHCY